MARFEAGRIVTRHFDLYPTAWLMARAPETWPSLWHAESAWPVGESLARVDSYVLLGLGWLLRPVMSGLAVAQLVAWIGPALGAFAAERAARRVMGVARPASLLAGIAFGFAGVAGTAVLEGHVYHLLDPWLPLLITELWGAPPAEGRAAFRSGARAGLWWALALWTTAYFGILATLLVVVAIARGLVNGGGEIVSGVVTRLAGAATVAGPMGLAYVALFSQGGAFVGSGDDPAGTWKAGAATLGGLAGWSDALDVHLHSIGAPVGFTTFTLLVLAPVVLARRPNWRTLSLVAFVGLVLALGRDLRVYLEPEGMWWPGAWVAELPGTAWFRFPVRFTWLYALGGGLVAARVLGTLGERLPLRLRSQLATVPSAYTHAPEGRPVLDLFAPAVDGSSVEVELWVRALGCYYQSVHARPILEVCIGTDVDSPRERVGRWLMAGLMDARADQAVLATRVGHLGLGAVALHADGFRAGDRQVLVNAMTALWGAPFQSDDGGAGVLLWVMPAASGADPMAEWTRIAAEDTSWDQQVRSLDHKIHAEGAPDVRRGVPPPPNQLPGPPRGPPGPP